MKYDIKDIPEEGQRVTAQLDRARVHSLLRPLGVEFSEEHPSRLEAELTLFPSESPEGKAVTIRGWVKGSFGVSCARCLGTAEVKVEESEVLVSFLPPQAEGGGEEELNEEDLDTYTHDGLQIDLEPFLREQMVLAIPITPLCASGCRGICTTCGADLNAEGCSCAAQEQASSPWVKALQGVKLATED